MPASSSARSSISPAGPTNGLPARSSLSPGASPTSIAGACAGPSPNTVWVASFQSGQARQRAASSRRVWRLDESVAMGILPYGPSRVRQRSDDLAHVAAIPPLRSSGPHQALDVDRALANLGQVVIHLHPKPGVGSAANGFLQLDGHFRRDPATPCNQIVELLPRDAEALGCGDNRNVQLIERVANQLAGAGWIFHLHVFLPQ